LRGAGNRRRGPGGARTKLGGVVEAGGLRAPGLRDTTSDVAGEDHKRLGRSRVPRRRTIPAEGQLTVVEISAEIRRRAAVLAWLGHRLRFRETQGRGFVLKRRNRAIFGVHVTELRRLRSVQRIRHYPCQSMPASGRCGCGGAGSDDCGQQTWSGWPRARAQRETRPGQRTEAWLGGEERADRWAPSVSDGKRGCGVTRPAWERESAGALGRVG